MKRFLVIGGWVIGSTDAQPHYVGARYLVDLYRVRLDECVLCDEHELGTDRILIKLLGVDLSALTTLRPRPDGKYAAPQNNENSRTIAIERR